MHNVQVRKLNTNCKRLKCHTWAVAVRLSVPLSDRSAALLNRYCNCNYLHLTMMFQRVSQAIVQALVAQSIVSPFYALLLVLLAASAALSPACV
jgi:hypothetical protein